MRDEGSVGRDSLLSIIQGKTLPTSLSLSLSRFTGPREEERTHGEDGGTTAAVEWPRRAGATVGMG